MSPNLASMFDQLSSSYSGLFKLLYICFWLAGLVFIAWGVNNFRVLSSDQYQRGGNSHPVTQSLISILIGGVLISLPEMLKSVAFTVFLNDSGAAGLLDYEVPPSSYLNTMISIRTFVQLFGIYMFGRGWMSLRQVGLHGDSHEHNFKSAVVRIFAGICLVHIVDFLKVLAATFGIQVISEWLVTFGV